MKNNNSKKIIFFLLIFYFFLVKANFVLALEQQYPPIFGLSTGNGTLPEFARYFFNIGMAMAGILAAIVIAFGGVYYLISLGMGKFTDEGKQWIKAGVLGLLLTVSSYLIASTINPNLVVFRLDKLLPIIFNGFSPESPPNTTPFVYYNEIPIGTLTENLLSRTMNCYDYDGNGDPIEGQITTDDNETISGPTLLDHDRVDCFLKLIEATEKKAKLIKNLSDKIVELMQSCTCQGKCDSTVDTSDPNACNPPVVVPPATDKQCLTGTAVGAACKPLRDGNNDSCPPGIKDKIEHGPIKLSEDRMSKDYKGLDEFRTQLTNISEIIEIQPKPKKDGVEITIININKWKSLKLIEQLMYFNEKMDPIKSNVEKDLTQLKSAENVLGQCYLAEPYIDFLKTVEKTKKEDKIIVTQKTFSDPVNEKQIDVYKYCKGFDYANSNSYMKCQNICPETLKNESCYNSCGEPCNKENPRDQVQCLESQTQCMKICYDKHECPTNTGFTTFQGCIQELGRSCLDTCDKKYSNSSQEDLQECQEKCGKDSKCLLENEGICTVNFPQLKACSANYSDSDNLKNCANNSFLCKYGSDEYAGYPDCTKTPQKQYSSSFLYKNPGVQRCETPYKPYNSGPNAGQTCLSLYPETAKCPTTSLCPKCPCGIVNETIDSKAILEYQIVTGTCNESSYNDDPLTFYCQQDWWQKENKIEEKPPAPIGGEKVCLKENEIPVGQTIDDAEKWGNELIKNINDFTKTIGGMIKYIKETVEEKNYCQCDSICEQLNGEGGRPCASNCQYVKESECPSGTCFGDDGICSIGNCPGPASIPERCTVESCAGNSCQKIINLLQGGATKNCPVFKAGIPSYYNSIYAQSKIFYKFVIVDARTDVLKELSYSRKKINKGSTAQTAFNEEVKILNCERAKDQIISPVIESKTTIKNKTIQSYCYGKNLGKILNTPEPMADNWFYCEERQGISEE